MCSSRKFLTLVWWDNTFLFFVFFNLCNVVDKPRPLGPRPLVDVAGTDEARQRVRVCNWTPVTGGKPGGFSSLTQTRPSPHRGAFLFPREGVKLWYIEPGDAAGRFWVPWASLWFSLSYFFDSFSLISAHRGSVCHLIFLFFPPRFKDNVWCWCLYYSI